jgi:hypothetical protein
MTYDRSRGNVRCKHQGNFEDKAAEILMRLSPIGNRANRMKMKERLELRDPGCGWNSLKNPEIGTIEGFEISEGM